MADLVALDHLSLSPSLSGRWLQSLSMPAKRTRKSYQNRRCAYCGAPLRDGVRTRDHVYPRSRGGTNRRGNLIPACRECNASKGDMAPGQWLASGKVTEVMRENGEYWRRRRFRRSLGV